MYRYLRSHWKKLLASCLLLLFLYLTVSIETIGLIGAEDRKRTRVDWVVFRRGISLDVEYASENNPNKYRYEIVWWYAVSERGRTGHVLTNQTIILP